MLYRGPWPLTHRQPSRPVPDGVGESREHPGPRVTRWEAAARCTAQLSRRKGTLGTGMTCAGRVAAVRSWLAARPALHPLPRTWSSRSQDALDGPAASARHRSRNHDQDGRDDDADDPPDPVDAARRLHPERCGEVVADEHPADPADNSQPERNVVAVARREELAQQANDDAGDDHTNNVHSDPFTHWERPYSLDCGSPRPAEGSIQHEGDHRTTEVRGLLRWICGPARSRTP